MAVYDMDKAVHSLAKRVCSIDSTISEDKLIQAIYNWFSNQPKDEIVAIFGFDTIEEFGRQLWGDNFLEELDKLK